MAAFFAAYSPYLDAVVPRSSFLSLARIASAAPAQLFASADVNADGRVTAAEAAIMSHGCLPAFADDGYLALAEDAPGIGSVRCVRRFRVRSRVILPG